MVFSLSLRTESALLVAADRDSFSISSSKVLLLAVAASNCENDVRQLEGAINRLYAYAAIMVPNEINVDFATEALKGFLGTSMYITNNIQRIQRAVAEYFNLSVEDLKSKKRTANINYARQIGIYLSQTTTDETLVKIGLEFGNRDHSTVMHGYNKISKEIKE